MGCSWKILYHVAKIINPKIEKNRKIFCQTLLRTLRVLYQELFPVRIRTCSQSVKKIFQKRTWNWDPLTGILTEGLIKKRFYQTHDFLLMKQVTCNVNNLDTAKNCSWRLFLKLHVVLGLEVLLLETVSGTSTDRTSSVLNHCSQPTLLTKHSTNSSNIIRTNTFGLTHLCLTSSKPYTRKESTISPFLMMTNQMTKSIKTKLKT